ncbi:hypothetical protein F959_01616 [Acinetobacter venetianus RAG-1 = CIP 110063]|uniref:Uncharacterized protein n=1 Tax=Acinetobacter venetianus (strain ATCC 31012 / DSM 23050 / BCRC 14357 / CCUG 45561 / CIP 110063 / KCTC 2702 / LMG 19082 / RAG-1) TaxID=1191460 RepID=N9A0D5_ACIVR|nr:hypothetical protein [Acinetobacter venetianus]ENV37493.1 hypothetical protein F959_01616 [Acinetobacter venetianus RAG-1 = CIP 110063]
MSQKYRNRKKKDRHIKWLEKQAGELRNIKKSSLMFEDIAVLMQKMQDNYRQKIQLNSIKRGDVSVNELRRKLEQISYPSIL